MPNNIKNPENKTATNEKRPCKVVNVDETFFIKRKTTLLQFYNNSAF